jgi:putative transcriptional regulator
MNQPDASEQETIDGTLANQFLIAMPSLQDPWFSGTMSYLWKHNSEGALGIVINKPSSLRVADLMKELNIDTSSRLGDSVFHNQYVMSGGPVEKDKGFILHESGPEWEYTLPVAKGLSVTMSKDILEDIVARKGPKNYLIAMGCAGWDAGQLENEISENSWLTVPVIPRIIFSNNHKTMAESAVASLGISLSQLSSVAGHS